ncbi:alcohol dehydrogenase family protein [Roseibium sp. RKSG952]|uniref:alcohol dehydrogenase family protein n=1 Tax=Roseibium sp. RKSG952 TaxID=2529384 RepID=UPI0012BB699F|nr:alcohol dehydrogenase family protein [Roseibium sp. RKSG952]MTI00080.1 alcohol dehydrogenase [Roseibium sp. RKSG952]
MIDPKPQMSGVLLTGHGGLECLEYRDDLPLPVPKQDEVLIKVGAAAVNNTDINTRSGWYSKGEQSAADAGWTGAPIELPRIQGIDVCGKIVAVGKGSDPARVGERVLVEPCLYEREGTALTIPEFLGSERDGGFAEYVAVPARHAFRIESDLSDTELASFPCSYSTAENLLTRSGVTSGERVLITGASGGVGSAAVQLARARGAVVIAVSSSDKMARIREIGADHMVDRSADLISSLGRNSVDVVIDLVAGGLFPVLLDLLKWRGRYAVAGAIGGAITRLDMRTLYLKDLSFFGCTALDAGVFENLVRLIEENRIRPLVAATYPLNEITTAQEAFLAKQHIGKIVLEVGVLA